MTRRVRATIATLALLAAAATGTAALHHQNSTSAVADSVWGPVAPANPTPAPAKPTDLNTLGDSVWG